VAAAAALEGTLPAALGRLHPRLGTPYMAFLVMGVVSTVLLLGNALLSDRPSNIFWMMFKLSGICFLLSYLLLFPAFLILRRTRPDQPRPYRMGGGPGVAWVTSVVCWLFIALACALFFKPSPTADNPAQAVRESWILMGETVLTIVAG